MKFVAVIKQTKNDRKAQSGTNWNVDFSHELKSRNEGRSQDTRHVNNPLTNCEGNVTLLIKM